MFTTVNERVERMNGVNWEADIDDICLESCEHDPSGYRVIFYQMPEVSNDDISSPSYVMGGSFLENRLKKLSRAGFTAPMTQKAIHMIGQRRRKGLSVS